MATTTPLPMPEQDTLVLATVKKIMPYGAFCTLDEYENREAFIHISEVASRWVKNIHEFVKEGQKIVARVHRVIPEKNQIDLSLRRVSESDKRAKLELHQKEKRALKLFELTAKKVKAEYKSALRTVGGELMKSHGDDLYAALEDIAFNGDAAFKDLNITAEWKKTLLAVAQANIKRPEVEISGTLIIRSLAPDGVQLIKKGLAQTKLAEKLGGQISLHYLGAPRYMITVNAQDYKTAEKILEQARQEIEKALKGSAVVGFERTAS